MYHAELQPFGIDPILYMMVLLNGAVPMYFGGSEEPAAYGKLVSVGGLGDEMNKRLSAALTEILELELSIPAERFYITFDHQKVQSQAAVCLHALHQ
ncbi:hypothetical protein O6H91_16G078600 [Diphasiastrum complanatum]|uniref:Uncharacterized protein n=1 Tax=Diphasiastrum complanatum TaxID=34168 RepID=A0ACC2BE13_DIPCM|nr:hypothetical protein O6H91_16G078600 [Diphasiastrum complanatum]